MDLWGPLAALVIAASTAGAYKSWRAGHANVTLACIVVVGVTFRIYLGLDRVLHAWDERFHALVARNLIEHPLVPTLYDSPVLPYDFRDWAANHIWLHKPPLALWLAAASMALFGINEIAFRLPSLLTSAAAILLTYRIGLVAFDARTAAVAAYLHAGSGLLVLLAAGVMTSDVVDNLFVVLIELAMWIVLIWWQRPTRGRAAAIGAAVGAALLTKLWPALLIVPIQAWLGYRSHARRTLLADLALTLGVMTAVAAPWFGYTHAVFPVEAAFERQLALQHLTESVDGLPTELSYYATRIPRVFGELVFLPLAWFLGRALVGRLSVPAGAVALWLAIPLCLFSLAASKSISYLAIAAPAIFLAQGNFWSRLAGIRIKNRWLEVSRGLLLLLLLFLPLRFAIERLNPFHSRAREAVWVEALRRLQGTLSKNVVLFGTDHPIEAMFFTGCTAYDSLPSMDRVAALRNMGLTVAVCSERPLSGQLSVDPTILRVPCAE